MRKSDHRKQLLIQKRRHRKRLKRKRRKTIYRGEFSSYLKYQSYRKKIDEYIISKFNSNLFNFLLETEFVKIPIVEKNHFNIIETFSLNDNYDHTINQIREITAALYGIGHEVVLDFRKCKKVDQAALIVLKIISLEIINDFRELDKKLSYYKGVVKLTVRPSKNEDVNFNLFLFQFLREARLKPGWVAINSMGYMKGSKSQKSYLENRKSVIATNIVDYVNRCLAFHKVELAPSGINRIEGLISEILGNAEDHSPMNTYYASANFSEYIVNDPENQHVGQLNISFLNFGYSIYDGFEMTKSKNWETYQEMEKLFNNVSPKLDSNFTRESLFTLYALQEGISSLKFEDESRGTGTMKFINSFFQIGDYENKEKGFCPTLNIFSGSTYIKCDNKYKPFMKNNRYYISLNDSENLNDKPSKDHLKSLRERFPGTVLGVNIYLNEAHLKEKIDRNGNS